MLSGITRIDTAHFGCVSVNMRDVFRFPHGLAGLEDCHRWVLLEPPDELAVCWLQAVDRPAAALAVVEPRRFVPDYQLRTSPRELARLELRSVDEAELLVLLNRTDGGLALDLKAPIVLNRRRRIGRQVVSSDGLPLRYLLGDVAPRSLRKTA